MQMLGVMGLGQKTASWCMPGALQQENPPHQQVNAQQTEDNRFSHWDLDLLQSMLDPM